MRASILTGAALCVSSLFCMSACGSADRESEPAIDVEPQSLAAAQASLSQIDALLKLDPTNQSALTATQAVAPVLDRLNHLLATVELSPGRAVSFYEPVEGLILISERGPQHSTPILGKADYAELPVALYKRLAKVGVAPAELEGAQRRASLPAGNATVATLDAAAAWNGGGAPAPALAHSQPSSSNVASKSAALTAEDGPYFRDHFCEQPGSAPYILCLPNWANGGWAEWDVTQSGLNMCPYAGNEVRVKLTVNGVVSFIDTAYPGEWRQWMTTYTNQQLRRVRWDILDASGDSFHWSVAGWNQ